MFKKTSLERVPRYKRTALKGECQQIEFQLVWLGLKKRNMRRNCTAAAQQSISYFTRQSASLFAFAFLTSYLTFYRRFVLLNLLQVPVTDAIVTSVSKKTWTKHSSDTVLQFVQVFLKQTLYVLTYNSVYMMFILKKYLFDRDNIAKSVE